ncbi:MAG: 3-oxoacyl-ACP reductase FabG [Chloroflexi bacterium]|nr:3-oxoacyl-ACP reductase FabG [Chloroflexota bacterium]
MSSSLEWFSLSGKVAFVTGGSRGLGKAIAMGLAGAGASVVVVGRNLEAARAAASEIESVSGQRAIAVSADVSRSADVDTAVAAALAEYGQIDILVNNAGVNIRGDCTEYKDEDWLTVLHTNLSSVFYCCRAVGRHMVERRGGRVINLASMMGAISMPGRVAYSSTKAGVVGLTKTLALEWASYGITVNAICPGPFATEMNLPVINDPVANASFTSKIPVGRWGEMNEVAAAALYLASDLAGFTTGASLFVDGGWTSQ